MGARLRRSARIPVFPGLKLPLDFMLGAGAVSFLLLLLGLCGLYRPWVFAFLGPLLLVLGRWRKNGWQWGNVFPAAMSSLLMVPLALAPPFFYDALVYHLALPWQALLEGGWHAHPESIYAAGPPLAQLCALPFLVVNLPRAYAFLHLLAFISAGAALYTLCRLLGARRLAFLAGFCLPVVPLYVLVPALPAAEGWAVLGVTTAAVLLLRAHTSPLAGLLAGFAVAARLQVFPVAAGVVALGWVTQKRWRDRVLVALGFVAGAALWWGKNLLLLGQPLLPLGWTGIGAPFVDKEAMRVVAQGLPVSEILKALVAALAPHASYLLPLFLASVGTICVAPTRRALAVALLSAAGLVGAPFVGLVSRYLAGVAPFWLALPAAARTTMTRFASGLALVLAALLGVVVNAREIGRWGAFSLMDPAFSVEERLVVNNPFPAFRRAQALEGNARVLFVGEPRGFLFPRRFVSPSVFDEHPLAGMTERAATPAEMVLALRKDGFTHLLINWGELQRLVPGYPCAPWRSPRGRSNFLELVKALEPPVMTAGPVAIYALELRQAANDS